MILDYRLQANRKTREGAQHADRYAQFEYINARMKKQLGEKNRDGSYGTQAQRAKVLQLCADQLHEMGYRKMTTHMLKPKHVDALTKRWLDEGLSSGTIKNRISALRWGAPGNSTLSAAGGILGDFGGYQWPSLLPYKTLDCHSWCRLLSTKSPSGYKRPPEGSWRYAELARNRQ